MKWNHYNSGGDACARLVFALQSCLYLTPLLLYGDTREVSERIKIGDAEYVMTSYEQRSESNSLVLGLAPIGSSAPNARPPIELLALKNATANTVDTDMWVSSDFTVLCLLLRRSSGGNIGDYNLYTYKFDSDGHGVSRFRGHFVQSTVLSNGAEVVHNRFMPLNIRRVLIEQLDERSPLRNTTYPVRSVRSIQNVRFDHKQRNGLEIAGILNDTFRFRLTFSIDLAREIVSVTRVDLKRKGEGTDDEKCE